VVRERGWVNVDELERLTGERRDPDLGNWAVDPGALQESVAGLRERLEDAGPLGLDLALLDDRQRAVVELLDDAVVDGGHLRPADAVDTLADHPFLAALAAQPFAPPDPGDVDRGELREMVRRGTVVEQDGVFFAASGVEAAARLAARLLADDPDGFTVSAFREAAGNTRKHTLPLLARLDGTGVTRRRGDLRIGGPRLPDPD
jgi:selenocysteine-specific elongation factor